MKKAIFLIICAMFLLTGCTGFGLPMGQPDLAPMDFKAPDTAAPGQALAPNFGCSVKNFGNGNAIAQDGHFSIGFYLSKDPNYDETDVLLYGGRESMNTPMYSGEYKPVAIFGDMGIPGDTQPGMYYLLAVVDEFKEVNEMNRNNNVTFRQININGNNNGEQHDLIPQNFVSPAQAVPGGVVGDKIALEVFNDSTYALNVTDNIPIGFYISTDKTWDPGDVLLLGGREFMMSPVNAGEKRSINIADSMAIPTDTLPGNYYLLAVVDEDNRVSETDEMNNVIANPIQIGLGTDGVDIIPQYFASPMSADPGGIVGANMKLDVKNIGNVTATAADGYFFIGFYISQDKAWDNSDRLLIGGRESLNTPLAAGEIKPVSIYSGMYIPNDITPGSYYLLAVVEEDNRIVEADELNNVWANPIQIGTTTENVDVVPMNFASPLSATPGGVVGADLKLDVKNAGSTTLNAPDGWFFVGFYISLDNVWDNSDRLLIGGREAVYTPFAAGEYKPVSIYSGMTIPADIMPGNYYLIAVADETNKVVESNEDNNYTCNSITITQ